MNMEKLLQAIDERGDTHYTAADKLGITPVSFSRKVTGKRPWKLAEVKSLREIYDLSMREVGEIFFD